MNNQNYGVIGNCRTSTLVSQTEALSFYFFHSNHPAKFINRRSPSGISTEGAS